MSNTEIMAAYIEDFKKQNPNLDSLSVSQNYLTYKKGKEEKVLDISNIYIGDILNNGYFWQKLQEDLSAEDFFNVCMIHVNAEKLKNRFWKEATTNNPRISILEFLNDPENEKFLKEEDSLTSFIQALFYYQDYLNADLFSILNQYKEIIYTIKGQNEAGEKLSSLKERLLKNALEIEQKVEQMRRIQEEQKEEQTKMENKVQKKERKAGYISSIGLIYIVLNLGFILAIYLLK